MSDEQIEAVQVAVVRAINALGAALLGSDFPPVTSSPIPDGEIAQILASVRRAPTVNGTESVSPVPASPNPPTPETSVHSPHSGQEPTPQHDDKADR